MPQNVSCWCHHRLFLGNVRRLVSLVVLSPNPLECPRNDFVSSDTIISLNILTYLLSYLLICHCRMSVHGQLETWREAVQTVEILSEPKEP